MRGPFLGPRIEAAPSDDVLGEVSEGVVIRRCAWHGQYVGHPGGYRVDSWRGGLSISYTDGICGRCTARLRAEPTPTVSALRPFWQAIFYPERAALAGAALGIASILGLPGSFLDETLWRPARVIMIPAQVVKAQPAIARSAAARRVAAARPRPARAGVASVRPGTRGVLDPLIALEGTTDVPTAAVAPGPEPSRRDNPPTLPTLEEIWTASASETATGRPLKRREPALVAFASARPEERVEAP